MRHWIGLALAVLLLITGCRTNPVPPDREPEGAPSAPHAADSPSDSTPPTPPPANQVQLPATPVSIRLEPRAVEQGDMALLRFDRAVAGEAAIRVQGLGEQPKPYRLNGIPVALIGVPANARPASYPVVVTWDGGSWEGLLEVVRKEFTEDRLTVTEEQQDLYYDPRQQAEWDRLFRLRSRSEETPLWTGAFQPPLAGELQVTTYFGEIRFVNGVETGRHSGMDFGAETGTPILAPAGGKVIMAEQLIVTGWTVVIDHGFNLFTTYYHCDGIDIKPGDLVEPGQQIARVGSTGFSTGPHLHWTATIGNTPVDPWPLTQGPPLGVQGQTPRVPEVIEE